MSATTSAIPSPDPTSPNWSIYLDNQSFNVTGLDGTHTTISFPEINAYIYLTTAETAVAAFAIGFVSMLFIVSFLITPAAKIRKPIFALNLVSMFLVVIREICLVYVSCGPYQGVGQVLLGADAQYPRRLWSADILSVILAVAIYATIMISLTLQVRVVFSTEPRTQTILTIIGAIGVIVQTGFNMTWLVVNIRNILHEPTVFPLWVYTVLRIFFTSFVGVACLIFLYKLGFTIYRRRQMGMAIGPLEIIFIMFCQCLVVPLIFYLLDLTIITTFDNFDSLGQVFLVCTLPLSTLWASAEVQNHGPVNQTSLGSNPSSGESSPSKLEFWSRDKTSKDDGISDVENSPSNITDRIDAYEGIQSHPIRSLPFSSTLNIA